MRSLSRTVSLIISVLGALANIILAVQLVSLWRSFKWDTESEWEGTADHWTTDGIKLVVSLSVAYFAIAAVASIVGFIGIIKVRLTLSLTSNRFSTPFYW